MSYIQNSFFYGERRTSQLGNREYFNSVDELTNWYVFKNGSAKRRPGISHFLDIPKRDSDIRDIVSLGEYFVVLYENSDVFVLNENIRFPIEVSENKYKEYNLQSGDEETDIGYSFDSVLSVVREPPRINRIKNILGKVFLVPETGLPYQVFVEEGKLVVAPSYMGRRDLTSYKSFVRSFPIEAEAVEFRNFAFPPEVDDNSELLDKDVRITV